MGRLADVFIGLNAVRALSIISMLLVFASSIFVIVTDVEAYNYFLTFPQEERDACLYVPYVPLTSPFSTLLTPPRNSDVPNQPGGIGFAVINRLLIMVEVTMLILSEASLGAPMRFFDTYFPVLGHAFGLGPLGIFQMLIGASILSHHVDDFTLVAAFLLFALGCVNALAGIVFRDAARRKRSITAWRERGRDLLAQARDMRPEFKRPASTFMHGVFGGGSEKVDEFGRTGFGFGRQGEKTAGLKGMSHLTTCSGGRANEMRTGFLISKPLETLPRYAPPPRTVSVHSQETSSNYSGTRAATPEPKFKSSTTAI